MISLMVFFAHQVAWRFCSFVELMRTPICCAVSRNNHLEEREKLTLDDLRNEYLIMPIEKASLS